LGGPAAAETAHPEGFSNRPPVVSRVTLFPANAQPGTTLEARAEVSDPDGDPIELQYTWRSGGRVVGGNSSAYRIQGASKSETIEVTVVAKDGSGESAPISARSRVANQAPVLLGAVIEPLGEIRADHDITAVPRAKDPDGDEVTYQIDWRVNGRKIASNRSTLAAHWFKRGDRVAFTIVASDGTARSEPLVSDAITVGNASPAFTSTPEGFDSTGAFSYVPTVEDPDGDRSFRYRLVESPKGMRLDGSTGRLTWMPRDDQSGAHSIALEAVDRAGASATQRFTLTVGYEDSQPPAERR